MKKIAQNTAAVIITVVALGGSVVAAPNAAAVTAAPARTFSMTANQICGYVYGSNVKYFLGTCTKFKMKIIPDTKYVYDRSVARMAGKKINTSAEVTLFKGRGGADYRF